MESNTRDKINQEMFFTIVTTAHGNQCTKLPEIDGNQQANEKQWKQLEIQLTSDWKISRNRRFKLTDFKGTEE